MLVLPLMPEPAAPEAKLASLAALCHLVMLVAESSCMQCKDRPDGKSASIVLERHSQSSFEIMSPSTPGPWLRQSALQLPGVTCAA